MLIETIMGFACNPTSPAQEYYWIAGCSAPKTFPAELITGILHTPKGQSIAIPESAFIAEDWGLASSHNATDEEQIAFPDSLTITWFSIRERMFYGGALSLAALPFQKIFDDGYSDAIHGECTPFNEIRIGLAPGGYIIFWASGNGITKEIGMVRADTINFQPKRIIGSCRTVEEYVCVISQNGDIDLSFRSAISPDALKWSGKYRRHYLTGVKVATSATVTSVYQKYFDGGAWEFRNSTDWETAGSSPVPRSTIIAWKNQAAPELFAAITFDETEIFGAFEKLGSVSQDATLTLIFELNKFDYSIRAFLTDGTRMIPLDKSKTEVWSGAD